MLEIKTINKEEYPKTIARGLAELKLLNSKITDLAEKIGTYGVWDSTKKVPIAETMNVSRQKNQEDARAELLGMVQSYEDLMKRYIIITEAIDRTNLETMITVGGNTMSIARAIIYKNKINKYLEKLRSTYGRNLVSLDMKIDIANASYKAKNKDDDPADIARGLAEILYLIPKGKIDEINTFLVEFSVEIDGTLNEVNALTSLIYPEA